MPQEQRPVAAVVALAVAAIWYLQAQARWSISDLGIGVAISCIRFAAFDIRFNIGRRHELHIVTKL